MKGKASSPNLEDKVKEDAAAADEAARSNYLVGPKDSRPKLKELTNAPPQPKVIIDGYLLQDVGGDVAPGGLGKTTLQLYEAVHVILGRPLYGREIVRSGGVLIVTAEDDRETTLARLNHICRALTLTPKEHEKVQKGFHVEDVSATDAKLVIGDYRGIRAAPLFDELVDKYSNAGLAVVVLDPTSHLGPGETFGNDGMSQLMRTARALGRALNAAVRVVHHVAQIVARGDIRDQYAGRGGTAFADNSRGLRQLIIWRKRKDEHEGSSYELPAEIEDIDIAKGHVLAIFVHKISYMERDARPIILVRNGFQYRHVPMDRVDNSDGAKLERAENEMWRVVDYIRGQLVVGVKINKTELDEKHREKIGLTRKDLREALTRALDMFALFELPLPKNERVTNRKTYLSPEKEPNPANPAESRRNSAGGIVSDSRTVAANPAAAVHAMTAAGLEEGNSAKPHGAKEALAGRIPPNPAARKSMNGKGIGHA